jgi:hypothetical protein
MKLTDAICSTDENCERCPGSAAVFTEALVNVEGRRNEDVTENRTKSSLLKLCLNILK